MITHRPKKKPHSGWWIVPPPAYGVYVIVATIPKYDGPSWPTGTIVPFIPLLVLLTITFISFRPGFRCVVSLKETGPDRNGK